VTHRRSAMPDRIETVDIYELGRIRSPELTLHICERARSLGLV
jgi:hypothetical protein